MIHTLVAWVEDRPGVLARVVGMFRRRAFNIMSLAVGHSERPGLSRMTLDVEAGRLGADLVEANFRKIVEVVDVHDITGRPAVRREIALIKVRSSSSTLVEIAQIAEIFRARIADVGPDSLIVEVAGEEEKVARLIEVLHPKGILEIMRSGVIAMVRGRHAPEATAVAATPQPEAIPFAPAYLAGDDGDGV
jgi:acetolactate synthase-1/3 small subunit